MIRRVMCRKGDEVQPALETAMKAKMAAELAELAELDTAEEILM